METRELTDMTAVLRSIMICYLITAGVVALGLLATWTSGRDVGYRNAMRDAERLHDDDAVFRPGKGGHQ